MITEAREAVPHLDFASAFRRDGFGVVRHAVSVEAAARMRIEVDRTAATERRTGVDPLEVQVPRIVETHHDFAALAMDADMLARLAGLFGGIPHLVASYGHLKPERTDAHTGVHSDIAHLRGVPHHASMLMVKVMYALTPVGPDSGATVVFPGTHRLPAADQLGRGDGAGGVRVLLELGDVQIFHANLLHTATSNPSNQPRLSVWFVYAQPWMRVFPGHEHSKAFLDALKPKLQAEPALAAVFGLTNPYSTRS